MEYRQCGKVGREAKGSGRLRGESVPEWWHGLTIGERVDCLLEVYVLGTS